MSSGESTDADDVEATAEEAEEGASLAPFPAVDRDSDSTTTDDASTTTDQTTDDTDAASQSDERTGGGDDHGHVCDPDSPVPCQFQ